LEVARFPDNHAREEGPGFGLAIAPTLPTCDG